MASALRTLARRIERLESQGFIIPHYIKQISREETAKKYTMEDIALKSKYAEEYKGKTRIVSGERGLELIRSERSRRSAETRRQKEFTMNVKEQAQVLDTIIRRDIDRFRNQELASMFMTAYEANLDREFFYIKGEPIDAFIVGLLNIQSEVIEELQNAMMVEYWEKAEAGRSYDSWLRIMSEGYPTMRQRQALGDLEDIE